MSPCRAGRAVAAGLIVLALLGSSAATAGLRGSARVEGELIVGFRPATPPAEEVAVHARAGATVVGRSPGGRATLVRVAPDVAPEEARAAYLAEPSIAYAEPNGIGRGGFVPDDTWFPQEWHLENHGQGGGKPGADIEAEAGWDLSLGNPAVVVAVLDTGIDSDHPEFAGRIVPGWDFVEHDADPEDDNGHGTLVTGVLAANVDNDFGVAGVDPSCRILPVKVLDEDNLGTTFDLIAGIDFARTSGADVLNLSLVDFAYSTPLNEALQDAREAGAMLVACAGNGGIGDADVSMPGSSGHTISIGATTNMDVRAPFSATGQSLDFVAPGAAIATVSWNTSGDVMSLFGGCSAAAPIAAGIVSILKGLDRSLTTQEVRALLAAGAQDEVGLPSEDTPGWDAYMGEGRVDLRRTLEAYLAVVAVPPETGAGARSGGLDLAVRPNPAPGAATVSFRLPAAARTGAAIHDVAGRRVRLLARGVRPAGPVEIRWDGRDEEGRPAAAGIYFVRVSTPAATETRRIVLRR